MVQFWSILQRFENGNIISDLPVSCSSSVGRCTVVYLACLVLFYYLINNFVFLQSGNIQTQPGTRSIYELTENWCYVSATWGMMLEQMKPYQVAKHDLMKRKHPCFSVGLFETVTLQSPIIMLQYIVEYLSSFIAQYISCCVGWYSLQCV